MSIDGDFRFADDQLRWAWDLAIQKTGRVQHFFEGRSLPGSIETYDMVSKHLGRSAERLERVAEVESSAGHRLTALEYYYQAASAFSQAQHSVLRRNEEKRYLHGSALRCYDEVRRLSSTEIRRVEIPFAGTTVTGYLHLAPVNEPAPLVFFLPGIDMTKERIAPHELRNWATERGMHLFVFDGPGQGESNLRDLPLTIDNYEQAAEVALSHLLTLDGIDASRVGLYGMSFASYWAVRIAATDSRYKAAVFQWATTVDLYYLFQGFASPRYKKVLAFVAGLSSEEDVDAFIRSMTLDGLVERVACASLVTVGEFDQRSPLGEVYGFFDLLSGPAEMWVFADQHHRLGVRKGAVDSHLFGMDWLKDRLDGEPVANPGRVAYLEARGSGPNDPNVSTRRFWFEP